MGQRIERIKMKFIIGSVALVVGFVAASIALFQWLGWMGVQHLIGTYACYFLGLGGLVVTIFGTVLIRDAWALRNVSKGKHKSPASLRGPQDTGTKRLNTILPAKIVERKITVLKSRFNHDGVKLLADELKGKLFAKMHFLKPKPEEVEVVSIDRYYEPYVVVGGKYEVEYYKRHVFPVQVEEDATEIALYGRKFKPQPLNNHPESPIRKVELEGEALFDYKKETHIILDKAGREIAYEKMPLAPSEEQSMEKLVELGIKTEKIKISRGKEIDLLRSRIVERPSDGVITKEIFEVNERAVVYSPMYQLTFRNVKTGKEANVKIDGITGDIILHEDKVRPKPLTKPMEDTRVALAMDSPPVEDKRDLPRSTPTVRRVNELEETTQDLEDEKIVEQLELPRVIRVEEDLGFPAKVVGEIVHKGDDVTVGVGDLEIPSGTTIHETLMVKGRLKIGAHCQIFAEVEALRDVEIGAKTEIDGNVVSGGNILIGPDSFIHGSVKSAGQIEIGENAIIKGRLNSKSSVVLNRFAKVYGRA
jgi:acetyltransferase-like isoleucine patch superfamily enzyme